MQNNSHKVSPKLVVGTVVALAAVLLAVGVIGRRSQAQLLNASSTSLIPAVTVLNPLPSSGGQLELSGRIEPWTQAPIYARVSGYLKKWHFDIGAPVKAGQVLAEIDIPDLDQQLLQAKAELATARSNLSLAELTAKRSEELLQVDAVSRQEAEDKASDSAAKKSAVDALRANVDRIVALQGYARLTAPFDGVVTARNTDMGALINVGGAPGSELFMVSDVRRLRIYTNVPQRQVSAIHIGDQAKLTVPERPGVTYKATVQSVSQAINAASGTMLVQLAVDNSEKELLSGGYATVRFESSVASEGLSIPAGALIINKKGTQIAIVGADNRVMLRPVQVGRDMGNIVELLAGIDRHDKVIASPPDGIANGDSVNVITNSKGAP